MLEMDELTTYMGLTGVKLPELDGRKITTVSRLELITALEATLTRHNCNTIHLSKRKLRNIEKCLNTAYLHLDGMLDNVQLRFACAPEIIQTIKLEMLEQFLDERPLNEVATWGRSSDESLIQRFLCEYTCLNWWELVVGFGVGILLIPRGGNDGYKHHYFSLPDWMQDIETAIRQSVHSLTVGDLLAIIPYTSSNEKPL